MVDVAVAVAAVVFIAFTVAIVFPMPLLLV